MKYISNSQFLIPNSQFPIPYSLFPIPYSQFPIPNSLFPIPYSQKIIKEYESTCDWSQWIYRLSSGKSLGATKS
ncbi:MAG: hypothetical protein F6K41_37660 [Symploca sp. SIO3E6]|nr:hypothetical protein [Caldora sp. SIO3E6]